MSDREETTAAGERIDPDELAEHDAELLPERTAMSIIRTPGDGQILPTEGLDLAPPPMTE